MDTNKILTACGGIIILGLQAYTSSQVPGIERTENRLITGEQKLSETLSRGEDNIVQRLAELNEKQATSLSNLENIATKLQNTQSADFGRLIDSVKAGQTEYQLKILDDLNAIREIIEQQVRDNKKEEKGEPKK